jgi:hypothetical protein
MASRTITHITDDLDGSDEAETVTFGLHGATYEIDLSKDNQSKLEEALEPFLNVARRGGGGGGGGRRSSARSSAASSGGAPAGGGSGVDAKAVRVWAAQHDIQVPARGRIPGSVIEQYKAAQG